MTISLPGPRVRVRSALRCHAGAWGAELAWYRAGAERTLYPRDGQEV